jgi:hypothetical protein
MENIKEKLRKIQWNPKGGNKPPHIWDTKCKCDGCEKNNEIEKLICNI